AYGLGISWLRTGSAPTPTLWLLIVPLAALAALLGAALVLVWHLVPILGAYRILRYLAERAEAAEGQAAPAATVVPATRGKVWPKALPAATGRAVSARQEIAATRGSVRAA